MVVLSGQVERGSGGGWTLRERQAAPRRARVGKQKFCCEKGPLAWEWSCILSVFSFD